MNDTSITVDLTLSEVRGIWLALGVCYETAMITPEEYTADEITDMGNMLAKMNNLVKKHGVIAHE